MSGYHFEWPTLMQLLGKAIDFGEILILGFGAGIGFNIGNRLFDYFIKKRRP